MNITLPPWAYWFGGLSLFFFFGALVFLPFIVRRLETDFFINRKIRKMERNELHPAIHILVVILRELIGLPIFLMGVIMLFIPGQGLLTMAAGLMIMVIPGKAWLIEKLLALPALQHGLNSLRRRLKREEFIFPSPSD